MKKLIAFLQAYAPNILKIPSAISLFVTTTLRFKIKKNIKILMFYIFKYKLICINFISIFCLVCLSPIFSLIWLSLPSLYFLYKHNYKYFFNIWGITLILWHTIFTYIFLDFGPVIVIGEDHTKELLDYLLLNYETLWFQGLCYQTIYIFDALSQKIGFLIYIPIIFPIKKSSCMAKESTSEKSTNKSSESNRFSGWFGGESNNARTAREDFEQCGKMAGVLKRNGWNYFTKTRTEVSKDGKRHVTASQTWIPGLGYRNNCLGRDLSESEKELINSKKK